MSDMINRQTEPAEADHRLLILSKRLKWGIRSLSATSKINLTISSIRFDQGEHAEITVFVTNSKPQSNANTVFGKPFEVQRVDQT